MPTADAQPAPSGAQPSDCTPTTPAPQAGATTRPGHRSFFDWQLVVPLSVAAGFVWERSRNISYARTFGVPSQFVAVDPFWAEADRTDLNGTKCPTASERGRQACRRR
jgi:hypothetical protein